MSVKTFAGYGTVIAETPEEAMALYEFITNYRQPKPEPEPASVTDLLYAAYDMMAEDPDIDFTDEGETISSLIQSVEEKIIEEYSDDEDEYDDWDVFEELFNSYDDGTESAYDDLNEILEDSYDMMLKMISNMLKGR